MQRHATPLRIDPEGLSAVLRSARGQSELILADWSIQPIHGGLGEGEGVYRLTGRTQEGESGAPWSLILKVLAPPAQGNSPSDWNYWRREADAYQSGALANLPGSLRAPRCYGVSELPNGRVWVWLEDIVEAPGAAWSLADYQEVAHHLGRFNGAYLAGRSLPSGPWVSKHWLRSRVYSNAPFIPLLEQNADHPYVRQMFPPDVLAGMLRIWAERDLLLDALDRLPQTFCHLDCHRSNILFAAEPGGNREPAAPVVIDWAFAGQGSVGADISPLVISSFGFFHVDPDQAAELEPQALTAYEEGLRAAGWEGDRRRIRLGYAATSALWHGVGGLHLGLPLLLEERFHPMLEQATGQTLDAICKRWSKAHRDFILRLADEARSLIHQAAAI